MPTLLVADDEPDAVGLLQAFLAGKGYAVSTACDGLEALRKVAEDRPRVVLLDIRMPRMHGLDVLQKIQEIDEKIGIIIVTGVSDKGTSLSALTLGAFDYIMKPLDLKYLERSLCHKLMMMTPYANAPRALDKSPVQPDLTPSVK